ncbi:glycosyltransferase family 2 protein [Alteromonas facilis]|uniref:glycosyltransferase family 2 protein n=1 Tax=Alteromonas facilis TaxID=2048004 RepID=UPI0013DAA1F8|nr:glycosyltransferase family 2 protein [Alteromonas facilis]
MQTPKVSVIIPTLNRDKYLLLSVQDMLAQDYSNFDIIVVDQSPAPTAEMQILIKQNPHRLRYFNVDFKGLPQARNYGWQHSDADIVLYIDDDIRSDENLVKRHVECYQDCEIGMVAGGIDEAHRGLDAGPKVGKFSRWSCTPYRGFASHHDQWVDHVPGGNFSARRELLEQAGGVDEHLTLGAALYEESELSLRVKRVTGKKFWFKSEARLLHLAADDGGCRVVNDVPRYIWGLSHNRAIVMKRYLSPIQRCVAMLFLLKLVAAYAWANKSLKVFLSFWQGYSLGVNNAQLPPKCTDMR